MSGNTNLTYYQRNREVILNKAKDYYKNDKDRLKNRQEINTKTYLKKRKIKKENMGKKDITICRKIRKKDYKNIEKIIVSEESLNIIINKIIF